MKRAEIRRQTREENKAKTATYNFTQAQLDDFKQKATDDAMRKAIILMLTLPLEVLMDHYWQDSYDERIPEFTEYVIDYFAKWENGELDMNKLREDLWEYGGVRLEETMD